MVIFLDITLMGDALYLQHTTYVRTKSKTVNQLEILKQNKLVKKFENFGTEYPQEVINLFSGVVDDLNVCFGYQDHNSFLIHETPAIRGKSIMHLSGISALDVSASDITAEEKDLRVDLQGLERKKQALLTDVSKFAELDKVDKLIDKYTALSTKYQSWVEQYNKAVDVYQRSEQISLNIQTTANKLNTIILNLDNELTALTKTESILWLEKNIQEQDGHIKRVGTQVQETEHELAQTLSDLVEELGKAKQCPLCGGELSAHSIDYIFKEFGI
jgi:hypothetical protein